MIEQFWSLWMTTIPRKTRFNQEGDPNITSSYYESIRYFAGTSFRSSSDQIPYLYSHQCPCYEHRKTKLKIFLFLKDSGWSALRKMIVYFKTERTLISFLEDMLVSGPRMACYLSVHRTSLATLLPSTSIRIVFYEAPHWSTPPAEKSISPLSDLPCWEAKAHFEWKRGWWSLFALGSQI